MKIIQIEKISNGSKLIDELLSKSLSNDYLFEQCGYYMTIQPSDGLIGYEEFLYRKLWEKVYLRRNDTNLESHMLVDGNIHLFVSLSEAIGLINFITPPALKKYIPESIKTTESISDVLSEYLFDDKPNQQLHYKSEFQRFIKFGKFDTVTTYNFSRINMLRTIIPDGIICDLRCHTADKAMDLCNCDNQKTYDIQLVLNANNEKDLKYICNYIDNYNIINVFTHPEYGYFVELYIPEYSCLKDTFISSIIQKTQSAIYNKLSSTGA